MGTYTPTHGTAAQFTVATITIRCVVTSFTRPSNPVSGLSYNLWDSALSFDFKQTWVQVPACGLAFTDVFTWTGLNTYVTQDSANTGRINAQSSKLAAVGTHAVSLQNTITVNPNGDGASFTYAPTPSSTDKVEFTITIANPCKTTTVNEITMASTDSSAPYSKGV